MITEIKANEAGRYIRITCNNNDEVTMLREMFNLLGANTDPWGLKKTHSKRSVYLPYSEKKET